MSVPKESKTGKKKKVQTCAQRGKMGGERFLKTQEAVLHSEGGKLGMMDTRQRATAGGYVCIWTLREKKWPILTIIFCCFYLFLTDHTSVRYALPLQTPLELWMHCERRFKSPRVVVVSVEGGGAFSHPRVKYQLWLCEHTHCAYLLANAHTHCQGNLATRN